MNVWGVFAWTILAIDALLAFDLSQMPRNQPTLDIIGLRPSWPAFSTDRTDHRGRRLRPRQRGDRLPIR
jgi:hypothetical protein